jgi:hypothetical protein
MKKLQSLSTKSLLISLVTGSMMIALLNAADEKKDPIKEFMKACHKAPQGVDPICKKASDGKASADELKKLVDGYTVMAAAKPPKGDDVDWKDKTSKLLAASKALQKNEPGAAAKYKEAVNCKSCHTAHKPD